MKAAIRSSGVVGKILGAGAILALALLGITRDDFWKVISSWPGRITIIILIVVAFLWYLVEIVTTVLNEYEKDRYAASRQARKERACYRISKFLKEGRLLKTSGPSRQAWDQEVTRGLLSICGDNARRRYLWETGRVGDDGAIQPLEDRYYEKALEMLAGFIYEDFEYSLE